MTDSRLTAVALFVFMSPALAAERSSPYVAMLSSGQRIESEHLRNWHVTGAMPHLGTKSLLDAADPFHWLRFRDRQLADEPEAFVEFTSGDRLPGIVVDYHAGDRGTNPTQPPHLVVRVSAAFEPPYNKPMPEIRILPQFVRRIVWQRLPGISHRPGTALYRDGRSLSFRALRWRNREVHVLTPSGDSQLNWNELAELHLPSVNTWVAWFDQLAALCSASDVRLLQVETTSGLVVTTSVARAAARFEGNSADPSRWVHGLGPAWSLDLLWIPLRDIVTYRSFATNEVPLSQIAPQKVTQRGLATSPPVQVDRSTVGSPLRSRTQEFGWGFGVLGGTELAFELPTGVRSIRTSVCLDRAAGEGGCIQPRILGSDGEVAELKPLWKGPVLVGSDNVIDSDVIHLSRVQTLVLQIDATPKLRPRGADPLGIRDYANWCDPLLELDPAVVQAELGKRSMP
jgi:hypothetical protein